MTDFLENRIKKIKNQISMEILLDKSKNSLKFSNLNWFLAQCFVQVRISHLDQLTKCNSEGPLRAIIQGLDRILVILRTNTPKIEEQPNSAYGHTDGRRIG